MKNGWKILAVVSFTLTLFVNFLAATSGINGKLTGAISDRYPTLFTPAGYVFGIWSLIYLGLLFFVIYALTHKDSVSEKIIPYFVLTNLLNTVWMICWHYDAFLLSVFVMLGLLITLVITSEMLYRLKKKTLLQVFCVGFPFALYLGWISVATIANISVYLVSISWNGFGLSQVLWTMILTAVAMILSLLRVALRKDLVFLAVVVWALWGIRAKLLLSPNIMLYSPSISDLRLFIYYEVVFLIVIGILFGSTLVINRRGGK